MHKLSRTLPKKKKQTINVILCYFLKIVQKNNCSIRNPRELVILSTVLSIKVNISLKKSNYMFHVTKYRTINSASANVGCNVPCLLACLKRSQEHLSAHI